MISPTIDIWFILCFHTVLSQYECHNASSCAYDTIVYTGDNDTNVECYGSLGCMESTIISNGTANIYCDGSFSCYKSNLLVHYPTNNQSSSIICRGLYSCAFVSNIYNQQGNIHC